MLLSLETRRKNESTYQGDSSSRFGERCEKIVAQFELSERESEVFTYLALGRRSTCIVDKLFLSPNTVKLYIQRIYKKHEINRNRYPYLFVDPSSISKASKSARGMRSIQKSMNSSILEKSFGCNHR